MPTKYDAETKAKAIRLHQTPVQGT